MSAEATNEFIYERIARCLSGQIRGGLYRAGDRLPSVRQLCARERVSPASVVQALSLLEASGLAEARPRSGFYVRSQRQGDLPHPPASEGHAEPQFVGISEVVAGVLRQAGNPRMLPFGAALPAPRLLPTDRLSRSLAGVARLQPIRYEAARGSGLRKCDQ